MYEHLKGMLERDMGHWIHKDEKVDMFKNGEANPYFSHTLERSYMLLWGCEDIAVRGEVRRVGAIGGGGSVTGGRGGWMVPVSW